MDMLKELAELEHKQWAHWTKYMLNNLTDENITRWLQQCETDYDDLTEEEKDSDKVWAMKVISIMEADGAVFKENQQGGMTKEYFKLSNQARKEVEELREKLFGHLTENERELLRSLRC